MVAGQAGRRRGRDLLPGGAVRRPAQALARQVASGQRCRGRPGARLRLAAWLRGLRLPAKAGQLADPPGPAGSLVAESAAAASALAGLEEEDGNVFGSRRVIVLYTGDLTGRPPAGELTGDTVLVVMPGTCRPRPRPAPPRSDLLAAGAAQAAVVGPEVTGAQTRRAGLGGLSQGGAHESVSAPVLFANDSAALSPHARRPAHRAFAAAARGGSDRGHQRLRVDTGDGSGATTPVV